MLRALVIDEQAHSVAKAIRSFAELPANWYRPWTEKSPPPGDNENYVCQLDSFRCVFSITEDGQGNLWRHLSISVPSEKYPHPIAAFWIAELFGFTGYDHSAEPPREWIFRIDRKEHCVVLGEQTTKELLEFASHLET